MQSVEFIKPWKIYSPGDVAGFEPEQAERLVEGGAAKKVEVEVEAKPPEVEAEAKPTKAAK